MSDLAFEAALAAHNEEYAAAEEFGEDWYPDDETYIVVLTDIKKGSKAVESSDKPLIWWRLICRIDDVANAKVHGREFPITLNSNLWGKVKSISRPLNNGQVATSPEEADAIFERNRLSVLKTEVFTTVSKKNGREYKNVAVKEVINTTSAEPVDPTPEPNPDGNS